MRIISHQSATIIKMIDFETEGVAASFNSEILGEFTQLNKFLRNPALERSPLIGARWGFE
jgi:hypothetical protein